MPSTYTSKGMSRILVTGANGFIASHVIDQLVRAGHRVRGTLRSLRDETKVESVRRLGGDQAKYSLELVEADLLDAGAWHEAVKDMDFVVHMATPVVLDPTIPADSIIKPALDGTLNVLKAAAEQSSVKRVVLTASGRNIVGFDHTDRLYSEDDWADADKMDDAYYKSKVLAERAAWDFVAERKSRNEICFELAVINPNVVFGPLLNKMSGASIGMFLEVFRGKTERIQNVSYPTCDVRDVALAHIRALFVAEAAGHRHIVSSTRWIPYAEWALILRDEFAHKGHNIPTQVEDGEPHLPGTHLDDSRMKNVLGIERRDLRSTVIDMANSVIELGVY